MALMEYRKKRSFNKTPEPTGGKASDGKLHFVIQKHAASRLHYDFRLEMKGVLKSWAIPKGPSLNPADKRLAMLVEDHPYDYKNFEGKIPEGNYGAGTVIIWDQGTYEPVEKGKSKSKTEKEKLLLKGFHSGSLKITMHGKKLKGVFTLVRTPRRADNAWLLIKHNDKYATEENVTAMDKSVVSGKTIEQMAESKRAGEWKSNRRAGGMLKASEEKSKVISARSKKERKALLNPNDETQVCNLDGHHVKFTNLSKVFWPEEKITKRDMLNYYYQVVPYMLPYMKDRPQTLNRYPNGIYGQSFYQKDVTGKVPDWIVKHPYHSEADKRAKNFLVCTDEASLLYIASLGCIEMNPWSSRTQTPDHPDWCIIDLDPDENPFHEVIEAAQVAKQVLDTMGVPSYCKTSGSTGLHIYIPLAAKYDYEDSKEFARAVVKLVSAELPKTTSTERITTKRKGKIYLDFLQNRLQATVAAPYSLRPKPYAPVSMPLNWEEVKKGLKIRNFTLNNAMARLKEQGDCFKGVLGKGADIKRALSKI